MMLQLLRSIYSRRFIPVHDQTITTVLTCIGLQENHDHREYRESEGAVILRHGRDYRRKR